ncbi:MAG: thioesterase family protein [Deltaproteobacteria bacterium]|nr:thioesterase family protein [Deltaproteobacteria bacterium]
MTAYFRAHPDGTFHPSEATRGPWDDRFQHGGPPSALLARAVEHALSDRPGLAVARLTVEMLRPVPLLPLRVEAAVSAGGSRSVRVDAVLRAAADGTELFRARALCLRSVALAVPAVETGVVAPPPPAHSAPFEFPFFRCAEGYHRSVEIRMARGTFGAGPVAAWMRLRGPVVAGEAPTPLQRLVALADSGNGVSVVLDLARWTFVNPDLTVHLLRMPVGEWICLEATTLPGPGGIGIADTRFHDERGVLGRGVQTLFIDERREHPNAMKA